MLSNSALNDFAQELQEQNGELTRADLTLLTSLNDLQFTERELTRVAERVQDTAHRVRLALDANQGLNSLGELQSTALQFDLLVAQRQERVQSVLRLADVLGRLDVVRALLNGEL